MPKQAVKKTIKKRNIHKPVRKKPPVKEAFFEAVGRRKTSSARARIFRSSSKEVQINGKPCNIYFPTAELQEIFLAPLKAMNLLEQFKVLVKVAGGGLHSQAEAGRHALARALILVSADYRKRLKKEGYLTRDSRMRERKKFGLKRARRAPQWRKR